MGTHGYDRVKRVVDVFVAAAGLLLTAPLQLVLAALVRRDLGRPVLFRQERPGRNEEIFRLVKFRTMTQPGGLTGNDSDEERLTPLGRLLRSASLDELPTLWNVVKGDMSLVGPRPLLVHYLDLYSPLQRRRHEVRPGITGLAQVTGRNALSWEDKFRRDLDYVGTRSLMLDMRILVSTVGRVLSRQGISDDQGPTMTEFQGRPLAVGSPPEPRDVTA
jgi:lipopolysaccharide/colanic/teichoic acid biosynthesis glycosyltransferase